MFRGLQGFPTNDLPARAGMPADWTDQQFCHAKTKTHQWCSCEIVGFYEDVWHFCDCFFSSFWNKLQCATGCCILLTWHLANAGGDDVARWSSKLQQYMRCPFCHRPVNSEPLIFLRDYSCFGHRASTRLSLVVALYPCVILMFMFMLCTPNRNFNMASQGPHWHVCQSARPHMIHIMLALFCWYVGCVLICIHMLVGIGNISQLKIS